MIPKPTPKPKVRKPLAGRPHRIPDPTRAALIARDPTCPWCREPGGRLDPHHRLSRAQGGSDDLSNLVGVHRKCHRWIHEHPAEARRRGFIIGRAKA